MIKKEELKKHQKISNCYEIKIEINNLTISIDIQPDDVEIDKTIFLANSVLKNFKQYEKNALNKIVDEFFENYNENWIDEENPRLTKKEFNKNLKLDAIVFMSDKCIDFFYKENGMFGNHLLIATSYDGEEFCDASMFG